MKTPEEAAKEYCETTEQAKFEKHNGYAIMYKSSDIDAFLAGDANGFARSKEIWRKPSECPERQETIVILNELYQLGVFKETAFAKQHVSIWCWCYLSDFLTLLPDWASSQQKEGE